MARPPVLGLNGAIGSGKSAARAELAALGIPGIDADQVARAIHQDAAHPALGEIGALFPQALGADGRLRRGSLPALPAADPEANAGIKRILKPWVLEVMARWTHEQNAPVVVWESALIIDESLPVDRVLVVDTDDATRFARLCERQRDWSGAQIRAVMAMQALRSDYLAGADDVVDNGGTRVELRKQLERLHAGLISGLISSPTSQRSNAT
ncbi:MAG: dephospho-CoA kinase [Massilia sp.]